MNTNDTAIIIEHLFKNYGTVAALNDIALTAEKGKISGFLGPDGSGKTTLFKILATLILPDNGKVFINGFNVSADYKKIRNIIGYMPEKFSLYQDLSVEENLTFFADIFGTSIKENYGIVKDIYSHIEPFKDRLAGRLSGGMKQKLALSCALIHKPEILLLDEPTTGVDPVSRKEFWEILKKLAGRGITILVSTPYMDEARLCDKTAFILNGKLLINDTPENILKKYKKKIYAVKTSNFHKTIGDLKKYRETLKVYPFGEHLRLILKNNYAPADLIKYLQSENNEEIEVLSVEPEIEDCFMELAE